MNIDAELDALYKTGAAEARASITRLATEFLDARGCIDLAARAALMEEVRTWFETVGLAKLDVVMLKAKLQAHRPR